MIPCIVCALEYGRDLVLKKCGVRSQWDHEACVAVPPITTSPRALPVFGAVCKPVVSIAWEVCATRLPIFHGWQAYLVLFVEEVPRRRPISHHFHVRSLRDVDCGSRFLWDHCTRVFANSPGRLPSLGRGSSPVSAPNAIVGEDFEAPVIPLRISPLNLSNLAMAVFCLTLLHQTIDA